MRLRRARAITSSAPVAKRDRRQLARKPLGVTLRSSGRKRRKWWSTRPPVAIPLAEINFFGWPLSFYMAAQGSLIIYVVILYYYAKKMRQLDVEYGVDEGDQ